MEHQETIEHIAELMAGRIESMQETDEQEGNKDKYSLQEYIAFALEEVSTNDGIVFTKEEENADSGEVKCICGGCGNEHLTANL